MKSSILQSVTCYTPRHCTRKCIYKYFTWQDCKYVWYNSDMKTKSLVMLEYNKILDRLSAQAVSERTRVKIKGLLPYKGKGEAERHLNETTEALKVLESIGSPPLSSMEEFDRAMSLVGKDTMLLPEQLTSVALFLTSCRRMKLYLKRGEYCSAYLSSFEQSIDPLEELEQEIERCIRGDSVDEAASPELKDIRRQIGMAGDRIRQKLDSLLRAHPEWFMEAFVIQRNGRYALPVRKEFRRMIEGSVIDTSQTGSTVFIEPVSVRKAYDELNELMIREENEIRRILYMLTGLVEDNMHTLRLNTEAMETLDFLFAKAKLSASMAARPPRLTEERRIIINNGRHPLLDPETVVPLKFAIGNGVNAVVITGPNTGGKTVALKTVGLLSLMAQSGLHVPTNEESLFCMNSAVLCDIGDGQSIEQNLSTFSSHMKNIIEILKEIDGRSLVLLDELGSGTDPTEGMGLAIALLEEIRGSGCLLTATTHYPEIKEFAANTPGFCNARMAFDLNTLMPLYRLEIGLAGESCALHIAERLGLPRRIVEMAYAAAYDSGVSHGTRRDSADISTYGSDNSKDAGVKAYLSASDKAGGVHVEAVGMSAETTGMSVEVTDMNKGNAGMFELPEPDSGDSGTDVKPPLCTLKPGDSIRIRTSGKIGIVYAPMDDKGNVGVQVQDRKFLINHKRIRLFTPAEELYPDYPNYDLSIVLDTVANRKARHRMGKGHFEGNEIIIENNEQP